jgi:hypothetical protein
MRVAALAFAALLPLGAGVAADPPAFDGSRDALTIPDAVWARVLADAGREGRALGYTADEMKAFGKDAHLLRNVQALFADARKIPRETGRITTQLLENAANLAEIVQRGHVLCDVNAGRMYAPPKDSRWGLKVIDAHEHPVDALAALLDAPPAEVRTLPPPVARLLVRLLVGQGACHGWVDSARGATVVAGSIAGRLPDADGALRALTHGSAVAPWKDDVNGQTATWDRRTLDLLGAFDRARMAYGATILAVHLDRALDEWRRTPAHERASPELAQPLTLRTKSGETVRLFGPGPNRETLDGTAALVVDLGGDDVWSGMTGAAWGAGPTSCVHIDLGGNDRYEAVTAGGIACGLLGVGIVVDEAGDDRYSCAASGLGRGLFGIGLLLDVAGHDSYRSTDSWCQGAGHAGVGALVDLAGDDDYECTQQSQGLGGTLGAGLLIDVAGNDSYVARDDGNVSELYLGQSVAMSQGCGYGRRADLGDGWSLAGGVGVLVDGAGDDRYHAQVWAQGCGYWWGLGILEDRGGDDAYQNGKYSAGAAAHFAIGVCIDLSGDDLHNAYNTTAKNQFQGHARDGSIGVFVDGAGDDAYDVCHNCAGSGDLNSIGLFWDRRGNDRYTFHPTDLTEAPNGWNDTGAFGTSTRYKPFQSFRDDLPTWGVFLDTGGDDTYVNERPPKGFEATPAANGSTWKPHRGPLFFGLGYDLE